MQKFFFVFTDIEPYKYGYLNPAHFAGYVFIYLSHFKHRFNY